MKFDAILFDLDGTLVDSAPDLAFALNQVLQNHNHKTRDFAKIRKLVSKGGKALIAFGFEIDESDENFKKYHLELLEVYQQNIAKYSKLFLGKKFLDDLPCWGVVTNKPTNLTNLLLNALSLNPQVVICGDSLTTNKPSAEPVLAAMAKLNAKKCVMIGDDIVDILAGKNANITTIAVEYGYGIVEQNWGYDYLVKTPQQLEQLLKGKNV